MPAQTRSVPQLLPALALALALAPLPAGAVESGSSSLRAGTLSWGLAETATGSEIWLRLESAGHAIDLAAPGARVAARRAEPLPLLRGGDFAGLAWLEGDAPERHAVRFAPRHLQEGEGWGAVEEVAPIGPGSQLALAGTALADGRLLLVWAAFDGADDEILYALRSTAGAWSRPARVDADDALPDITPAVIAVDEGALVAWSGFDGDQYRVYVARFDGERFRPAHALGPAGSVFPTFEPRAGAPLLIYRNAHPRGWSVAELSRSGTARRTAFLAGDEREAPRVERQGDRLLLRWADSEREARWR